MRFVFLGLATLVSGLLASAQSQEHQADWEVEAVFAAEMCLAGEGPAADRSPECRRIIYDACPGRGGSTGQMDECSKSEVKFWDGQLNRNYKALMKIYAEGDALLDEDSYYLLAPKLRDAQRAWLAYRQANCVNFERNRFRGGTLGRLTAAWCFTNMTADRAQELADLLDEEQM